MAEDPARRTSSGSSTGAKGLMAAAVIAAIAASGKKERGGVMAAKKRGKRDSMGRLRDAKGRLMKEPGKKKKAAKKSGKKKAAKKRAPGVAAIRKKSAKGKSLASRVHALEQGQNALVGAVNHLGKRVSAVEHVVVTLAHGLKARFGIGAGGSARQLGAG